MWSLTSCVGVGTLTVGVFVRRVTTASGATAVQIVHKRGLASAEHRAHRLGPDVVAVLLQDAVTEVGNGGMLRRYAPVRTSQRTERDRTMLLGSANGGAGRWA